MNKIINVMRALAKISGEAEDRVLRLFYVQAVCSCLLTVGTMALQQLETAQNAALRVMVSAQLWTKCVCLRAETRLCTVSHESRTARH